MGWNKLWPHFPPHAGLADSIGAPVSWNCPRFSGAWADAFHTHWSRALGGVYRVLSPRGVYSGRRGTAWHCLASNTRRRAPREEAAGGVKVEVCPGGTAGGGAAAGSLSGACSARGGALRDHAHQPLPDWTRGSPSSKASPGLSPTKAAHVIQRPPGASQHARYPLCACVQRPTASGRTLPPADD